MLDAGETRTRIQSYSTRRGAVASAPAPATYYGLPSIKASPWTPKVPAYVFLSGVAGGAQMLAAAAHLGGDARRRSIVRNGSLIGALGALGGAPMLIADLKTSNRFYNMLRIFRITSPLSIGSWVLTAFGGFSSIAALGGLFSSRTRAGRAAQAAASAAQLPAAIAGAGMATYTGSLLAASNVPIWTAAPNLLTARFGASAVAAGAAALSLCERAGGNRNGNAEALDRVAMIATASSLALALMSQAAYKRAGVDRPLHATLEGRTHKAALVFGHALPLAALAAGALAGRRAPALSVLASVGILAGSWAMRHSIMLAEKSSARLPEDYFRTTRFRGDEEEPEVRALLDSSRTRVASTRTQRNEPESGRLG